MTREYELGEEIGYLSPDNRRVYITDIKYGGPQTEYTLSDGSKLLESNVKESNFRSSKSDEDLDKFKAKMNKKNIKD